MNQPIGVLLVTLLVAVCTLGAVGDSTSLSFRRGSRPRPSPSGNVCAHSVRDVADHALVWKIVQRYGSFFGARKGLWEQLPVVKDREYLYDTDTEFLESSWCNRNANWVAFLFVGYSIHSPEKEYYTVADWRADIAELVARPNPIGPTEQHPIFLVTVPKIHRTAEAPRFFFYNTHWFVVQIIPSAQEPTKPNFKIFSGFARHYRVIDYLKDWDINAEIPDDHRLKLNRTTYAGEAITFDHFIDVFLAKLQVFMDEVNTKLEWTQLANSIHAELFFADKFKDMVVLERRALEAEKSSGTAGGSEQSETEDEPSASVFEGYHSDSPEPSFSTALSWNDRWHIPLMKAARGDYELVVRRYHYTDQKCQGNARKMMSDVYGRSETPAKPLKLQQETY